MADTERNEDQKISSCLQEAFGYTDEQLLKQLDQANETLKDVTFDGAEDRIMKKFMARKAEMEKETAVPETETERKITLVKAEPEGRKEKKIVRFGKKKVLATVALVAVIAGMLGGTAVGKKSYYFKKAEGPGLTILVDNDKNNVNDSKLQEAYKVIEQEFDVNPLQLGYIPANMKIQEYEIFKNEAEIKFIYNDNIITYYAIQYGKSISANYESDRSLKKSVYSKWINKEVEYQVNMLDNGKQECEATIIINDVLYHIAGILEETEFKKIIQNFILF